MEVSEFKNNALNNLRKRERERQENQKITKPRSQVNWKEDNSSSICNCNSRKFQSFVSSPTPTRFHSNSSRASPEIRDFGSRVEALQVRIFTIDSRAVGRRERFTQVYTRRALATRHPICREGTVRVPRSLEIFPSSPEVVSESKSADE